MQWTGVRTLASTLSRGHQHGVYRRRLNLKVGEFHRDNNVRGHAHGRGLVDRKCMRTLKAGHDHKRIWEHIKWATR